VEDKLGAAPARRVALLLSRSARSYYVRQAASAV